jgi:hypothetical protein
LQTSSSPIIQLSLTPSNQIHQQQQNQQVPSLVQFFTDDVSTLPSDSATYHNTKATQKPEQAKVLRPSQTKSPYHSSYGYDVELLNLCEQAYNKKNQDSYNKVLRWMEDNKGNVVCLRKAAIHTKSQEQTPLHLLVAAAPPLYLIESFMEHSVGKQLKRMPDSDE